MTLAVLALSAVLALVPASCGAQPAPTAHAATEGAGTVRVVRVTDGDTFTIDSGAKIRVLGIDSCEAKTPAGPARHLGGEDAAARKDRHPHRRTWARPGPVREAAAVRRPP